MRQFIQNYSTKSRARRAQLFREQFKPDFTTKILDIGSETGENIYLTLQGTSVLPQNVFIADIDPRAIELGSNKFGYNPVLLDESGTLPSQFRPVLPPT